MTLLGLREATARGAWISLLTVMSKLRVIDWKGMGDTLRIGSTYHHLRLPISERPDRLVVGDDVKDAFTVEIALYHVHQVEVAQLLPNCSDDSVVIAMKNSELLAVNYTDL